MHVGICCVWWNGKCWCFYSLLTTHLIQVVLLCFLCRWMAGWLWLSRSAMWLQKVSQWGREKETGGTAWQGWSDKHNFRLQHAEINSATCLNVFYSNVLEQPLAFQQNWNASCAFLGSPCLGNRLNRFPTSDSCRLCWSPVRSNKWILCQPQAVWCLSISIWPLYFPFLSHYSQSVVQKHTLSISIS